MIHEQEFRNTKVVPDDADQYCSGLSLKRPFSLTIRGLARTNGRMLSKTTYQSNITKEDYLITDWPIRLRICAYLFVCVDDII